MKKRMTLMLLAVALVLGLVPDAVQALTDEKPEAYADVREDGD